MSYDLNIWLRAGRDAVAAALFADQGQGSFQTAGQGRNWVVNAGLSEVDAEDIPPEVVSQFRGATLLVQLHAQPSSGPALAFARKLARRLAEDHGGAVEDPQMDKIWVPKAHRLDVALKAAKAEGDPERMTMLSFGWWFTHDDLFDKAALSHLLDHLNATLPEVMPRRYGTYEPPQFRRDRDGLAPFVAGVLTPDESWFAYTSPPAYWLFMDVTETVGWFHWRNGSKSFQCRHIDFGIDATSLLAPGYMAHLQTAFLSLSGLIRPFYAEVRPLHNLIRKRGTCAYDGHSETHPIRAGWWKGIPSAPALARLVATPYDGAGTENWTTEGGQKFVMQQDWREPAQIGWDGPQDDGRLVAEA